MIKTEYEILNDKQNGLMSGRFEMQIVCTCFYLFSSVCHFWSTQICKRRILQYLKNKIKNKICNNNNNNISIINIYIITCNAYAQF